MLKKNIVLALFFCTFTLARLPGAAVSCLVIETGLPQGSQRSQYSAIWENNLMDVFFETGHIVSNGRIVLLVQKPDENFPIEAERDFEEAKENGMDYFLIAIIEHPVGNESVRPQNVYLRLFSTKSQELINEQVYKDNKPRSAKEENESIKKTIGAIAAQIR
jgi:hypothetical protein